MCLSSIIFNLFYFGMQLKIWAITSTVQPFPITCLDCLSLTPSTTVYPTGNVCIRSISESVNFLNLKFPYLSFTQTPTSFGFDALIAWLFPLITGQYVCHVLERITPSYSLTSISLFDMFLTLIPFGVCSTNLLN